MPANLKCNPPPPTVCSLCFPQRSCVYDSPGYAAQAPCLQLSDDLCLQQHGLPRSHFLPQQISHSSGELRLSLNDLGGLLVHYKRAEGDIIYMREEKTALRFMIY